MMFLLRDLRSKGLLDGTRYLADLDTLEKYSTTDGKYDEERGAKAWEKYLMRGEAPEGSGAATRYKNHRSATAERTKRNIKKTAGKFICRSRFLFRGDFLEGRNKNGGERGIRQGAQYIVRSDEEPGREAARQPDTKITALPLQSALSEI